MNPMLEARYRQFRNNDLYNALDQASGLPYQERPDPVMTGQKDPKEKHKNKMMLTIVLVIGAIFLFRKSFKKEMKKL